MKKCVICGRRIWSSAVSVPEKGDYHYECAKETGALLSLNTDLDAIAEVVGELETVTVLLRKRRAEGADSKELSELLQRMSEKMDYLNTLKMVHAIRLQESFENRKGA